MKEEKPDVVLIQEMKCSMDKIREIHNKWLIKYEYLKVMENNSTGRDSHAVGSTEIWCVNLKVIRRYI